MKNILYLSLALFIFACSSGGNDDNNNNDSNNNDSNNNDSNNNDDNNNPPAVQIGDFVQGGIVFWINPDDPNNGMVISAGQNGYSYWGGYTYQVGQVSFGIYTEDDFGRGQWNTNRIVEAYDAAPFNAAAHYCDRYEHEGYDDWFLANKGEWQVICNSRYEINAYIEENGGDLLDGRYWTSSELNDQRAVYYTFNPSSSDPYENNCSNGGLSKYTNIEGGVKWRAVREFQL